MTNADVRRACGRALSMLPKRAAQALSPGNMKKLAPSAFDHRVVDGHAIHMVGEILKFIDAEDPAETEKAHRWLGFLQGVLWMRGYASLDELRDMNRPKST